MFDREKQGAYALEVEARDGAPSARPNSNQQPNSGKFIHSIIFHFHILYDKVQSQHKMTCDANKNDKYPNYAKGILTFFYLYNFFLH